MLEIIIVCVVSYVLGSIPNGLILGKLFWKTDLREHGSHNIGATNAWRTLGKTAGISIFLLDFLKGAVAACLGAIITDSHLVTVICGILAVVGHSCSIFLKFKGGKSVATGLGVLSVMMPQVTALVFLVWFLIVLTTGYVSLGSIVGAALVPISAWLLDCYVEYQIFGLVVGIFVIYRHKSNIERLMNGTESKIKAARR